MQEPVPAAAQLIDTSTLGADDDVMSAFGATGGGEAGEEVEETRKRSKKKKEKRGKKEKKKKGGAGEDTLVQVSSISPSSHPPPPPTATTGLMDLELGTPNPQIVCILLDTYTYNSHNSPYSGTYDKGPTEIGTTSLQRTLVSTPC